MVCVVAVGRLKDSTPMIDPKKRKKRFHWEVGKCFTFMFSGADAAADNDDSRMQRGGYY